jgi:hypothetical protein
MFRQLLASLALLVLLLGSSSQTATAAELIDRSSLAINAEVEGLANPDAQFLLNDLDKGSMTIAKLSESVMGDQGSSDQVERSSGCSVGCSTGCSTGCSSGCSYGCSVGCSSGCSYGCSVGCN